MDARRTTRACRRRSATQMAKWGLAKDEFTDNGNWPHQIYVREARRMVGDYVMTEHDCRRQARHAAVGRHGLVQHGLAQLRALRHAGRLRAERGRRAGQPRRAVPDQLPVDRAEERASARTCSCRCACRSSHIAYGSIRMEPVFMVLGQSAATAAVPGHRRQARRAEGRLREAARSGCSRTSRCWSSPRRRAPGAIDPKKLAGVVVDDDAARAEGLRRRRAAPSAPFVGAGYRHDGEQGPRQADRRSSSPTCRRPGKYEVRLAYTAEPEPGDERAGDGRPRRRRRRR